MFGGLFKIGVVVLAWRGISIAKLTEDEEELLADPLARMLHGRKRLQAAIEKATDPGLFAAAVLAIVEARLGRKDPASAPASRTTTAQRGAGASDPAAAQRQQPPAASMTAQPAAHQRAAATVDPPAGGGAVTLDRQHVDLDRVNLTPEVIDSVLDEMFADMQRVG